MTTIITVANQKGGVGKTTTAANVAAGLAANGRRVLAVDLDAQVNLTHQLGAALEVSLTTDDLLDPELAVALRDVVTTSPHIPGVGAGEGPGGLDVLPGSEQLSMTELALAQTIAGQTLLRQALETARGAYDVVVVDTPPNLGMLTINGLVAADVVLAPVSAEDVGAAQGFARLRASTAKTAPLRPIPPAPVIALLTRWDERRVAASQIEATLCDVLDAPPVAHIPLSSAVHRAAIDRVPLVIAAPAGTRREAAQTIAREYGKAAVAAIAAAEAVHA